LVVGRNIISIPGIYQAVAQNIPTQQHN
jgi:hypothetical protein